MESSGNRERETDGEETDQVGTGEKAAGKIAADGLRVSVKFQDDTADLVEYLDAKVLERRQHGQKSDRSHEIRVAIRRAQLADLSAEDRARVLARLKQAAESGEHAQNLNLE